MIMTPLEQDAQLYQGSMTLQKICTMTGLPISAIRGAVRRGDLKAIRPQGTRAWRVPREEVQRWLKAGEVRVSQTNGLE